MLLSDASKAVSGHGHVLGAHRRRAIASASLAFATIFAGSSSVAHAVSNCQVLTELGGQEYSLESSTKLSIVGFEPVINYVRSGATSRFVKITAASEEPSVTVADGALNIGPASCKEGSTTEMMTSAAFSLMPGLISSPLLALASRCVGSTIVAAYFLNMIATNAYAQGTPAEECLPTLQLDISVPYDCPYDNFVDGLCMTPRMIADMAVHALFVDFDVAAAEKLLAEDYIQHNPTVPTGRAPVLGFIPALEEANVGIEVHRTFSEGPLVAYHSTYTNAELFGGPTLVGFDIFRVENGKVQEHWDNLQPLRGPTPSGHTMVDGATMVKYRDLTETNKALAVSLVETVLVGGNVTAAPDFISSESYIQHNPDIADGLEGIAEGFAALAEAGLDLIYDSVELVVAEGNFVLVCSIGEYGKGNPAAYYDLLRVIQDVPPESEFAHENGKF